jgi:beta-lactamase regulating signal transducer with metallopeptidase domain
MTIGTGWLLTYLVHSTILIAGAWLLSRRLGSAQMRDLLWKVALVGGIVTASLQSFLPSSLRIEFSRPHASISTPAAEGAAGAEPAPPAHTEAAVEPSHRSAALAAPTAAPAKRELLRELAARGERLAPLVWIGLATLLVLRLLFGHLVLLRTLRQRRKVTAGEDFDLLLRLARANEMQRSVRLSRSTVTESPIAMLGGEIVLPDPLFGRLTAEQRGSVLAHELSHVQRRDPAWLTVAGLINAILFFQPLNRVVRRELKETAEFICDDVAVRETGDRRTVAATLAVLAETITPRRALPVSAMAEGGSGLVRRVSRILRHDARPDEALKLPWRVAITVLPLSLIAAIAPAASPAATTAVTPAVSRVSSPATGVRPVEPAVRAAEVSPSPATGVDTVKASERPQLVAAATHARVEGDDETYYVTGNKVETAPRDINRFAEGRLNQSFDGPEGATTVTMNTRSSEISLDGSSVRFFANDGYLRVRQEASNGPTREVEVTASASGEPRHVHRVDGKTIPWSRDAERVIAASFRGEKAWDGWTPNARSRTQTAVRPPHWDTHLEWTASVGDTTTEGGERREVKLIARGVHYNPTIGEIFIDPDGRLEITETLGSRTRTFVRTAGGAVVRGDWDERASREWVRRILREQSSLPANVIERLSRTGS